MLRCNICIFGYTLASILASPYFATLPRDIDVLEVFTVAESVATAARDRGLRAETFDYANSEHHSATEQNGFLQVLTLVMRVREGGLACIAPECSSFSFACVSRTRRCASNFSGDPSCHAVQQGNMLARVAFLLFMVAVSRGVYTCFENPAGSMLFSFLKPHIQAFTESALQACRPMFWYTDRCGFANDSPTMKKTYKFMSNGVWFFSAVKKCQCKNGVHLRLMDCVKGKNDKVQINGNQFLKKSGLYPTALGAAIVQAWQSAISCPPKEEEKADPDPWATAQQADPWGGAESAADPWAEAGLLSTGLRSAAAAGSGQRKRKSPAPKLQKARKMPKTTPCTKQDDYDPWG